MLSFWADSQAWSKNWPAPDDLAEQTQAVRDCYSAGILVGGELWKVNPALTKALFSRT